MLKRVIQYFRMQQAYQRINLALSRGGAMSASRRLDLTRPDSWEFSGFSQNGEDGLIEVLADQLIKPNRTFLEIGSADGLENNTAWLAIAHKYCGLMVEGSKALSTFSSNIMARLNLGVKCVNMMVNKDNVKALVKELSNVEPDVFSIDIDGNDFYITELLLQNGLKPKIIVVEYNSAFGPDNPLTVSYKEQDFLNAHETGLYYGVGIAAWRQFFHAQGYRFISVDRRGVNGVFVRPECFSAAFLDVIEPTVFVENFFQYQSFRQPWAEQFKKIEHLSYKDVA
jgi:hypothetical protein